MIVAGEPLLSVRDLTVSFGDRSNRVTVVPGVSFDMAAGRIVALVGESGSGKTVTAFSIVRLIRPPGRIEHGRIIFGGEDLLAVSNQRMRRLRGDRLSMIFQNPMNSLHPSMTVGKQIVEVIQAHRACSGPDAWQQALQLLAAVEIPDPERTGRLHAHELSGGMRQRVMIAMAVALEPDLLIADEPTTALDVTIQAQIIALLKNLQRHTHTAILFITHDLSLASTFCDDVIVMYAGRVVETGVAAAVFERPAHPYTAGLVEAIPHAYWKERRVAAIPGQAVPAAAQRVQCQFANRCPHVMPRCQTEAPALVAVDAMRSVRCFLFDSADVAQVQA